MTSILTRPEPDYDPCFMPLARGTACVLPGTHGGGCLPPPDGYPPVITRVCSVCHGQGGWQQPSGLIVECPRGCMVGGDQ